MTVPTAQALAEMRSWVAGVLLMAELGALDAEGIESIKRSGNELLARTADEVEERA